MMSPNYGFISIEFNFSSTSQNPRLLSCKVFL
uniref:Uncharacterized protein n=1 Tax=Lepeophtheirus salmonis TaxID=72036 RepID=A0A0K2V2R2_LEPSM